MLKKGLVLFLIAVTIFTGCSKETESDLFKQAEKHLARQEYKKAVDTFILILEKYPNGKYAQRSALEIAKLYHGLAVPNVPKKESLDIAVKYYLTAHSIAPKTDVGTNALFMAAFLEANEIKNLKKAKEIYEKFIKEYPQSPLAKSAKIEIANLGVPPEKIIEEKIKK